MSSHTTPIDLHIRPVGRPSITKDAVSGFQKIARTFAVSAAKVDVDELDKTDVANDPSLFRDIGEADSEYTDHFLVHQQIKPGETVDKAYLMREYVQLRDTWYSESISESGGMIRLTRKYACLRQNTTTLNALGVSTTYGYPDAYFELLPVDGLRTGHAQVTDDGNDLWDLLPAMIDVTEPDKCYGDAFSVSTVANTPPGGSDATILAMSNTLTTLNDSGANEPEWLRASAAVDTSSPGMDHWTCSWAAPIEPYWTTGSAGSRKLKGPPSVVELTSDGIMVSNDAQNDDGAVRQPVTFTYFVTATSIPATFEGATGFKEPIVVVDMVFVVDDSNVRHILQRTYRNAIYKQTTGMYTLDGIVDASTTVGVSSAYPLGIVYNKATFTGDARPVFRGETMSNVGGSITFTQSYDVDASSTVRKLNAVDVRPIHSHRGSFIWKVSLSYI